MPTDRTTFESKFFVKSDKIASDWDPIERLRYTSTRLPYDPWIYKPDLSEELIGYLREDVRATDEAYMRIRYTIQKVIFNGPTTIVIWMDGSKTIVRCMDGDIYDPEKALMMCIMERLIGGSKTDVKRFLKKYCQGMEDFKNE